MKQTIINTMRWLWSLDTRTAEWIIGNVFICRAVAMWLPGDAHESEFYSGFRTLMPSDTLWGVLYFIIGAVLWVSIIWNGRYRYSPGLRATACTLSATLLSMMSVVFFSMGFPAAAALYASLTLSSVYCVLNISARTLGTGIPKNDRLVL